LFLFWLCLRIHKGRCCSLDIDKFRDHLVTLLLIDLNVLTLIGIIWLAIGALVLWQETRVTMLQTALLAGGLIIVLLVLSRRMRP
jgi:hypothetical protein